MGKGLVSGGGSRQQLSLKKLQILLNFTSLLGHESASRMLVERFKQVIEEDLGIDRILFYIREEDGWELLLNSQFSEEVVRGIDVDRDLLVYQSLSIVPRADYPYPEGVDVVIPIVQNDEARAYVLLGDSMEDQVGVSPIIKHLPFAQTLSYVSFVALENFKLVAQVIREEEMRSQFKVASNLQRMLIPTQEEMPRVRGVEVASSYNPYYDVGGDYFDAVQLDEETLAFCIADVSGKGVPGALLMTSFQAHFRAHVALNSPLVDLVYRLNEQVFRMAEEGMFVTFFTGRYNCRTRVLEYVNAAQSPPILYGYESKRMQQLQTSTTGLGMVEQMPQAIARSIELREPSMLYCYTDGIVEFRREGREVYCTGLLTDLIPQCRSARELVNSVNDRIAEEVGQESRQIFDDMSQLAILFDPDDRMMSIRIDGST